MPTIRRKAPSRKLGNRSERIIMFLRGGHDFDFLDRSIPVPTIVVLREAWQELQAEILGETEYCDRRPWAWYEFTYGRQPERQYRYQQPVMIRFDDGEWMPEDQWLKEKGYIS